MLLISDHWMLKHDPELLGCGPVVNFFLTPSCKKLNWKAFPRYNHTEKREGGISVDVGSWIWPIFLVHVVHIGNHVTGNLMLLDSSQSFPTNSIYLFSSRIISITILHGLMIQFVTLYVNFSVMVLFMLFPEFYYTGCACIFHSSISKFFCMNFIHFSTLGFPIFLHFFFFLSV